MQNITKEDILKDLDYYEHRYLEHKELVFTGIIAKIIPFAIFEGEHGRGIFVFDFVEKKWTIWDKWAKIQPLADDLAALDHIAMLWNYMAYGMMPGVPEDLNQLVGITVETLDTKEKIDAFIEKMTKRKEG